jgi:uncharacterized membrane protein
MTGSREALRAGTRRWWIGALLCSAVAVVIRGIAVTDSLWLDEIWSLRSVFAEMHSVLDVFTFARDNNHQLISLWMYFVGDAGAVILRLPALLAGIGTVFLAARLLRNAGPMAAALAGAVFAFSYLHVVYSSEARGYEPAVCFALAAFGLLADHVDRPRRWSATLFATTVILGMMSHLGFVQFYIAVGLWHAWLTHKKSTPGGLRSLFAWHLAPVAYLTFLYFAIYRRLEIGGGSSHLDQALMETVAWGIGSVTSVVGVTVAAVLASALFIFDMARLRRAGRSEWIFYVLIVAVLPPLTVMMAGVQDAAPGMSRWSIYPRYFLLNLSFLSLSMCRSAHFLIVRGGVLRVAGILVVAWLIIAGSTRIISFLEYGRGDYATVVGRIVDEGRFPVRNSQQPAIPTITYGGDHTFRTSMIVGYYRLRHGRRDRLLLLVPNADTDRDPRNAPEWYLLHTFDHEGEITPFDSGILSASKVAYSLVATYRHYGPSGWTWGLYHRQR